MMAAQKTARIPVCTQDRCARAYRLEGLHGRSYYLVRIGVRGCERRAGRVIRLRIRVFNKAGKLLRHAKGRAKLHRHQPNGPDCPPTCYGVGFEYRGDTGRVSVR